MAFTFRILFSGLCAFVPNVPFEQSPQSIDVLLPNAIRARPVRPSTGSALPPSIEETDEHILPPHVPMLIFDTWNRRPNSNQPAFFIRDRPDINERKGVMLLLQQDVLILPDGTKPKPGALRLNNDPVPDLDLLHPTEDQEKSLFWLTKIRDVLDDPGQHVDPRFLGALTAAEQKVITRLRLDAGLLRVNTLSGPRWQYLPIGTSQQMIDANEGRAKRVATELALEIRAQERVEIVFQGFGANNSSRLIFAPPKQLPKTDVQIEIQNLEPDKILGVELGPNGASPSIDPDFSIYYGLLEGFQPGQPRPVPQRRVQQGENFIGGAGKPCSPMGG